MPGVRPGRNLVVKVGDTNDLTVFFGHQPLNFWVIASEPCPDKFYGSLDRLCFVKLKVSQIQPVPVVPVAQSYLPNSYGQSVPFRCEQLGESVLQTTSKTPLRSQLRQPARLRSAEPTAPHR